MNVNTGELRKINETLANLGKLKEEGFEPVPKHLKKEAEKELGDKDKVIVDMKKNTPLVNWAKSKRNNKSKRKMARASRKKNRQH